MSLPKDNSYVPYIERPGWEDIQPIPQDDGPNPLAPIAYSQKYRDTMDTFRAISIKEEISQRAYELTGDVIHLNPSHYTVWLYRQRVIKELNLDLSAELDFLDELVENNPKCYQLWQHRQFVIDLFDSSSKEETFFLTVIDDDSKNFHAWSYRQWILRRFNIWEEEIPFVESLIEKDVRNNSAWNQRYYVITQNPHAKVTEEIISRETGFAVEKIKLVPFNECPWNYLKGLYLNYYGTEKYALALLPIAEDLNKNELRSKHLQVWFVDIYSDLIKSNPDNIEEYLSKGIEACGKLINSDIVRANYWTYKLELLQEVQDQ